MAMVSVVRADRAWIAGAFVPAEIRIVDGVITEVLQAGDALAAPVAASGSHEIIVLAGDEVLLPGLVDSHVHLDQPGRTEWEGFATGTAAAAAGGITTLFDMPLNSVPVTTTPAALAAKRAAASGKLAVDIGYWGGAVPENLGSLRALAEAGVVGFKCFLVPSGIDEFGHLDAAGVRAALAELTAFDGLLIAHAEDEAHLHAAAAAVGVGADGSLGRDYATFLRSRPPASEATAIATVIEALRETGGRGHIVHVADGAALALVRQAKADGIRLTIETCPHYLTLAAEDVPDGASAFKCCPPIRDRAHQDLLWEGVLDGTVDAIVSDHSPSTLALKSAGGGDFGLAWGGIAGVQTGFASVWTEAARRGIPLESLLPLFTTGPARIAGVAGLGEIRPGARANLTVFAPEREWTVDARRLLYRHKLSPWDGRRLRGAVETTIVGGEIVYRAGDEDARARPGVEVRA